MHVATTSLPKSTIELAIELDGAEFEPYLKKAAASLSRERPLKGFRPGKVPFDVAVQQYGAMTLYEAAADSAVRDAFVRAVRDEGLKTIGHPKIELTQLAPDNPVKFTATVSVLPNVTLPDFTTISTTRRSVTITDDDVDKALRDLQKMQPNESLVDRAAGPTDKVIVTMHLSRGGVPIEGGEATGHHIYLGEDYALPKVREELIGMQKGEEKTFPLEFPKDHFQKQLAGTTVDCRVGITDVYAVALPPFDDAFAKRLGLDSLTALRGRIRENITLEAEQKARRQEELELLDSAIAKATIADLPELLITGEAHRMVDELERSVTSRGLEFETWLQQIKKTRGDLLLEMAPEAVKRVKVALLTRAVAEQQADACAVDEHDIETEIAQQLARYQDTEPDIAERIQSEASRDYVRTMLRNRKIIEWIREQVQWKAA